MSAPIFIQKSSMLSGLGADPAPRTEISESAWTSQVNQQWAAANPEAAKALSLQTMGANLVGIGLMVAGAITFALGQKAVGTVLGLGGAGAVVYGFVKDRTVGYGAATGLTVGSRPGVAGIGMV